MATRVDSAVVPPGYFTAPVSMALCPPGTYRQAWLLHSDPGASSCTACGVGIGSEPRDLDENPLATNGSLVRATVASCCESAKSCRGMSAWLSSVFVFVTFGSWGRQRAAPALLCFAALSSRQAAAVKCAVCFARGSYSNTQCACLHCACPQRPLCDLQTLRPARA